MTLNDEHKKFLCIGIMCFLISLGVGSCARLAEGKKFIEITTVAAPTP